MTFKLALSEKFWAPVNAEVQGENGERKPIKFKVQFKRLSTDEIGAFGTRLQRAFEDARDANEGATQRVVDMLMEVMTDWAEIIDEQNAPVPFSKEALQVAAQMGLHAAILHAFRASMPGVREKN